MSKSLDTIIVEAFKELYDENYGRTTWPAFKDARRIVRAHFGTRAPLVTQYDLIYSAGKAGKFKSITGNDSSIKGGEKRKNCLPAPKCPDDFKIVVKAELPPHPSARASWFMGEGFQEFCRRHNQYEQGLLL